MATWCSQKWQRVVAKVLLEGNSETCEEENGIEFKVRRNLRNRDRG